MLIVFAITLLFVVISSSLIARLLFNFDLSNLDFNTPREIGIGKFLQAYQMILLFGAPTFFMSWYMKASWSDFYRLKKGPGTHYILFATALLLVVVPFNDWLIQFNEALKLPNFMAGIEEWMRNSEELLGKQLERFLQMDHLNDLFVNILVIALLPAFLEELFFRGLIQGLILKWLRNAHISIIITALFFSAVHMQFYGFLPRFLLGVFLGYLFYWSGSLWAAIYFHFLNNLFSIVLSYLLQHHLLNEQKVQNMNQSNWTILLSFAATAAVFLLLANYYSKKRNKANDWLKVFTSTTISEAEIMKGKLEQEGITVVILNKKDFFFTPTGKVELLVKPEDFEKSMNVLNRKDDE